MIKWGTPVKIIEIYSDNDSEYRLIDLNKNIEHRFTFHHRTLKYQTSYQYFDAITTENLNELKMKIDQLSQIDKVGIDKGVVMEGMSKEGILIALGLPPIFVNPSPYRSLTWNYWFNKRNRFKVSFDSNGKVSNTCGNYPYKQQYAPPPVEKLDDSSIKTDQNDIDTKEDQNDDGIKEQLESLKRLYEEKLISKEDYDRKKAEILSEF